MIRIRLARREDFHTLFALDQACFREGIAYPAAELAHFLFHPHSISLVAVEGNEILGFSIVELAMARGRRIGHIITIDVDPAQRRRGVGRLLMEKMLAGCRSAGAEMIRLEVAVDNDAAIAFYRLRGFVQKGSIRNFYMGSLDAIKMELTL